MRLHGNAALSWSGRRRLAERVVVEGWTLKTAAEAAGVSVRCARKWVGRYRLEGERGLLDRSSRPRRVANQTAEERIRLIVAMRRLRFTGPEIAELLGMAVSTVSGILTRRGLGRLGRLGLEPPLRYERSRQGELIHVDVKVFDHVDLNASDYTASVRFYETVLSPLGIPKIAEHEQGTSSSAWTDFTNLNLMDRQPPTTNLHLCF